MAKALTFDEMMDLARKNYSRGGDGFYECWDRDMFDAWVAEHGPFTKEKALDLFRLYEDVDDDMAGW